MEMMAIGVDDDGCLNKMLVRDDGLTTAEYAVGTIAVIGLGGLMLRLLTSDWFAGLLRGVFESGFSQVGN